MERVKYSGYYDESIIREFLHNYLRSNEKNPEEELVDAFMNYASIAANSINIKECIFPLEEAQKVRNMTESKPGETATSIALHLDSFQLSTVIEAADKILTLDRALGEPPPIVVGTEIRELNVSTAQGEAMAKAYRKALENGLHAWRENNCSWNRWPDGAPINKDYEGTEIDFKTITILSALYIFQLAIPSQKQFQDLCNAGQLLRNNFNANRRGLENKAGSTFPQKIDIFPIQL